MIKKSNVMSSANLSYRARVGSRYRPYPSSKEAYGHAQPSQTQLADRDRADRQDWSDLYSEDNSSDYQQPVIHARPHLRSKNHASRRRDSTDTIYLDYTNPTQDRVPTHQRESWRTDRHIRDWPNESKEKVEYETFCNPDQPVNIRVELRLPITLDLDNELVELARLRRIGDFRTAKAFFASKLAQHMEKPYVFIQYADLLLAMEDYEALKSLQSPPFFGPSMEEDNLWRARRDKGMNTEHLEGQIFPNSDVDPLNEPSLLLWNWILIKALVLIHVEDCIRDGIQAIEDVMHWLDFQWDLGSTEVQVIVLCLRIFTAASHSADQKELETLKTQFYRLIEWEELLTSLSTQDRNWDCCELKAASGAVFGYRQQWNWRINNGPGSDRFDFDFKGPWNQLRHDETSLLACLDQTTSIAMLSFIAKPIRVDFLKLDSPNVECLMNTAADLLKRHYPAAMRSRPFIRWLIISSVTAGEKSDELRNIKWENYLKSNAGFGVLGWRDGVNLPIYVPSADEIPEWNAPETPLRVKEALELALNLAAEMEDYPTQAICYKLLALRSQKPMLLLEKLCQLQKAHGDRSEHLKTLLSSYIWLGHGRTQKQRLLSQLTDFPDAFHVATRDRTDIEVHWAHDVIKRALLCMLDGRHSQDCLGWVHADYVQWLPQDKVREHAMYIRDTRQSGPRRYRPSRGADETDWALTKRESQMEKDESAREARVAAGSSKVTLLERKKKRSKKHAALEAAREKEMQLAEPEKAQTAVSALIPSAAHALRGMVASPHGSGEAVPNDRKQLILWKGDYRSHEQWLALNRNELNPADYYRKWAVRNPDSLGSAGSARPAASGREEGDHGDMQPTPLHSLQPESSLSSNSAGEDSKPSINNPKDETSLEEKEKKSQSDKDSRPSNRESEGKSLDKPLKQSRDALIIDSASVLAISESKDKQASPRRPVSRLEHDHRQPLKTSAQTQRALSPIAPPGNIDTAPSDRRRLPPPLRRNTAPTQTQLEVSSNPDVSIRRSKQAPAYYFQPHNSRHVYSPAQLDPWHYASYTGRPPSASARSEQQNPRTVRWEDNERQRQNHQIRSRAPSVVVEGPPYPVLGEFFSPPPPRPPGIPPADRPDRAPSFLLVRPSSGSSAPERTPRRRSSVTRMPPRSPHTTLNLRDGAHDMAYLSDRPRVPYQSPYTYPPVARDSRGGSYEPRSQSRGRRPAIYIASPTFYDRTEGHGAPPMQQPMPPRPFSAPDG